MSQANLDLVRRGFELLSARRMDEFYELLHADVVWRDQAAIPGPGVHWGNEAVRRHFDTWVSVWQELDYELEELIDDEDRVIAVARRRGREEDGSAPVEDRAAYVISVRDELIIGITGYSDRAAAISRGGLPVES